MHEEFHLNQSLSTVYGFFYAEVATAQVRVIELVCNHAVLDLGSNIHDLLPLVRHIPMYFAAVPRLGTAPPEFLRQAWRLYTCSTTGIASLEAASANASPQTLAYIYDSFRLIEESRKWIGAPSFGDLQENYNTLPTLPADIFAAELDTGTIGASHVIEGIATVHQFASAEDTFARLCFDASGVLDEIEGKDVPREYCTTGRIFLERTGLGNEYVLAAVVLFVFAVVTDATAPSAISKALLW